MNDMFEKTMKMAHRSRLGTITILLAMMVSAPAFAQDPAPEGEPAEATTTDGDAAAEAEGEAEGAAEAEGADAEGDDAAAADEPDASDETEGEEPEAAVASSDEVSLPEGQDPLGNELQRYWSSDRDLATIENKLYRREGKIGVGVHVGLMSTEPFWWYLPVGGKASYNFSDQAGVEVSGQYLLASKTDLHNFIEGRGVETFDASTDLDDQMVWRANATFVWSPLYGKWAFLNNKLTHFDFNLVVGAGVVGVDRPSPDRTSSSSAIEPELVFGPGAHFFLTENWLLRADGRFYVYRGAETDTTSGFFDRLEMPIEFLLGGTYLF